MARFVEAAPRYDDLFLPDRFNGTEIFFKFYDLERRCGDRCKLGDLTNREDRKRILRPDRRQLFAVPQEEASKPPIRNNFLVRDEIRTPAGQPAFLLGEFRRGSVSLQSPRAQGR